jgi:hypothetical protein
LQLFWREILDGDIQNVTDVRHLDFGYWSHWVCQKVCWHKICTLRQAHSKPNKLASHAKRFQDVPVNFPWKLTKDKVVKF